METGRSIRKILVVSFPILIFLNILVQCTSAVSANPQQPNWDDCIQEEFSESLCNPGQAKNVNISPFSCKQHKPCCPCLEGYFLNGYNNCTECKSWRDCKAEGKEVLFEGNTTADAKCGDDIPRTTTVVSAIMPTTPPPTVEGSNSSIEPNLTKDEPFMSSTTSNPTGDEDDDDGNIGTPVLKFGGGCVVLKTLCPILVLVICLFICCPNIPKRLKSMLCSICCRSKKKPKTTSGVIHIQLSDQEVGGSSV